MPRVFRAKSPPPKGSSPKQPDVTKPPAPVSVTKKRGGTKAQKDVDANDDEEFIPPSTYIWC